MRTYKINAEKGHDDLGAVIKVHAKWVSEQHQWETDLRDTD